jgi:hypothetical protein
LYSNIVHGASFSTLCRKIEGKGPTLLLIKDTGGYVSHIQTLFFWNPNLDPIVSRTIG